jgi:hypothetical protein
MSISLNDAMAMTESSMRLADKAFSITQVSYLVNHLRLNNISSVKAKILEFERGFFNDSYRNTFDNSFGQDRQKRVRKIYKSVAYIMDYGTDSTTGQDVVTVSFYDCSYKEVFRSTL